jgi:hypothetical protein
MSIGARLRAQARRGSDARFCAPRPLAAWPGANPNAVEAVLVYPHAAADLGAS